MPYGGTLLAVTGEPGVGKTRLAEAAAGRAAGFVYCTGDRDEARQAEHAAAVTLIRP